MQAEFLFHFVHYVERIAAFAVQFVYEHYHRDVAHTAYLNEFFGLFFHALCHVYYHDDAVHCRQGAVGVLGEILVAGGIQYVCIRKPSRT